MKKEFDWNKFKSGKIAVHCKTKEEAMSFLKIMYDKKLIEMYDGIDNWYIYKEDTCYTFSYAHGYFYCNKQYYKDNGHTIWEFSDYFDEKKFVKDESKSHYGEIKFNGDCFIVKEREECNNPEWMYLCDLFGLDYDATEQIVIDGIVKYFGLRKGE